MKGEHCDTSQHDHCDNCMRYGTYKYGFFILLCVFVGCLFSTAILGTTTFAQGKINVSGLTEPIRDVILSAEVSGKIFKIHYREGDLIAQGGIILELNKKYEELDVERRKLIWESKAEVDSASERVITLKSILETTRSLFEQTGSVSKEELDQKELEYKIAIAEKERLRTTEERERIEYEMAIENLEKLILRSPIKGVITELFLDEGENCESNQPLVHVVDYSKCILVCYIEAALSENLKKGQNVDLEIPVGSRSVRREGRIIFISPVVDPASDLITVKVEFDNQDGSVRPGVVASMSITGS